MSFRGMAGVLAIGVGAWPQAPTRESLTTFTENEVAVEIFVERGASGITSLGSTFTPLRPKFHLYSKDLPPDGVAGLGRPTLLEVVSSGPLQASGPLTANRRSIERFSKVQGVRLPGYPDGPVTLTLPVTAVPGDTLLELSVTYMACSDRVCFPPVVDKRVSVTLPGGVRR